MIESMIVIKRIKIFLLIIIICIIIILLFILLRPSFESHFELQGNMFIETLKSFSYYDSETQKKIFSSLSNEFNIWVNKFATGYYSYYI